VTRIQNEKQMNDSLVLFSKGKAKEISNLQEYQVIFWDQYTLKLFFFWLRHFSHFLLKHFGHLSHSCIKTCCRSVH